MSSTTIEKNKIEEEIELNQLDPESGEKETLEDLPHVETSAKSEEPDSFGSGRENLLPLLETLSKPKPDAKLIQRHFEQLNSLAGMYLNIFLETPLDESGEIYREVLKIVLVAEDICSKDLASNKDLSHSTRFELKEFFQASSKLTSQLIDLAENADNEEHHHQLVSNVLSEATTKLQHNLAEFRTRQPEVSEETESEEIETEETGKDEEISETVEEKPVLRETSRKTGTNRWLLAATVFTALVSGTLFFVEDQLNSGISQVDDAEKIDVSKLEEGERLGTAKQIDGTMFVTAEDSWNDLSKLKKLGSLKTMLEYSSKQKVKTVIVVSGNGLIFENHSKEDGGIDTKE